MSPSVRFLTPALNEIAGATEYYLDEAPNAAAGLLDEIDAALDRIGANPQIGSPTRRGARKYVLTRFPYSLIYRITTSGEIVVVALAHHRRRAGYWLKRLK